MKKVYFACSIRSGRENQQQYEQIVGIIKQHAKVLSEVFTEKGLTTHGTLKPSRKIWETDLKMLREANAIIAEVTTPSLGVGYEISKAEEWGKPILCLYRLQPDRSLSGMIDGNPHVQVLSYENVDELIKPIRQFIDKI